MSARFAIPATTFVLKSMIEAELKAAYSPAVPPPVQIAPPPRPAAPSTANVGASAAAEKEPSALHLYMHHVAPNPAYRNMDLPYQEDDLSMSVRRALVLDLHYLLAATGAGLERETLLGLAMTALHRRSIMTRSDVFDIFDAISPPGPGSTDPMDGLTEEPLWDVGQHPESIKISQHPLDIDMSTKLWSALQSPIRPSAYYLVTTTVLDTGASQPNGPPVTDMTVTAKPTPDPKNETAPALSLTHLDPLP